jgi:DNA-binding response OmpR family regulator
VRLIVADDSAEMRWLVRDALRLSFTDIIEAEDGRQLMWQLLRATIGTRREPPTAVLVIADVCMPSYSGLEVLDAWHDDAAPVPMIVITSFPDAIVQARVAALGAVLLPKPFTRAALRAAVHTVARELRWS